MVDKLLVGCFAFYNSLDLATNNKLLPLKIVNSSKEGKEIHDIVVAYLLAKMHVCVWSLVLVVALVFATVLTLLTSRGSSDQIFLSPLQTILTLLTYMGFFDQIFFITVTNHLNSSNLHGFF